MKHHKDPSKRLKAVLDYPVADEAEAEQVSLHIMSLVPKPENVEDFQVIIDVHESDGEIPNPMPPDDDETHH